METVAITAECIGGFLVGIFGAVVLGWCGWQFCKLFGRPEVGPPLIAILLALIFHSAIAGSFALRMMIFFEVIIAVVIWPEARVWRARRAET